MNAQIPILFSFDFISLAYVPAIDPAHHLLIDTVA